MKPTLYNLSTYRIIATDALILLAVYLIPTMAHWLPVPIYYLDPMRIILFTGFLVLPNYRNAMLIAVTIPLFSALMGGHPPMIKALLISFELLVNIALLSAFIRKFHLNPVLSLIAGIVLSKIAYYTLKFVFIKTGLINGNLITTDLLTQAGTLVFIVLLFSAFFWKKNLKIL